MRYSNILRWFVVSGLALATATASAAEKVTVGLTSLSPAAMPIFVAIV